MRKVILWAGVGLGFVAFKVVLQSCCGIVSSTAPLFAVLLAAGVWGSPLAMLVVVIEMAVYGYFFGAADSLFKVVEITFSAVIIAIIIEHLVVKASVEETLKYVQLRLGIIIGAYDELRRGWMNMSHDNLVSNMGEIRREMASLSLTVQNRVALARRGENPLKTFVSAVEEKAD